MIPFEDMTALADGMYEEVGGCPSAGVVVHQLLVGIFIFNIKINTIKR